MFERFSDRARRAVVLAQEEARMLNHNYIGTEHLLLGLIHEGEGAAARVLDSFEVDLDRVRSLVKEMVGPGGGRPVLGHIPFTPRAKKVLELSLRESRDLGHGDIGTEHLLLGLIREGDGVGAQVMERVGLRLPEVRQAVVEVVGAAGGAAAQPEFAEGEISPEEFIIEQAPQPGGPISARCPWCDRPLEEVAVHRTLSAPADEEGGEPVNVRVLFCKSCGGTLGTAMS